ncbi:glycosyltransferase [Pseudomonadales bacterium]|nr:glycosyltransferase [Pseudomonadales bacterium]
MKISIITVCYNSEKTIRDTIESVLSQEYPDIEYIVIDGLSDDSTVSIINEYRDNISKIISEPDNGLYDAMNKGIKNSTGDVVGILNSDDLFENSTVISDVMEHFDNRPSISLLFGDVVHVDPNNLKKITRFYSSKKFKPFKLRFGWMPPHTATFIKTEVFKIVGDYSLDYRISADYELFVRMLIVNKLVYSRLDKVLVRMRSGGLSTSGIKSNFLLNTEIVKACRDNGTYTNFLLLLLKIPMKILELFSRPR